ncbi:hypothetical protein EV401DRAFT_2116361 [Pisolithus croceorrhizus]|nr:hypothetical protein EV401DRAFT_2116361 [Pisolithus croceorrhizus]
MSATIVFSFFVLANSKHMKMFRAGSSMATYHCIYETTIQCTSGVVFPAMLHVYSPFNDIVLSDNTVAFVSVKATIPANVSREPVLLKVPSDANTEDYKCHIPNFPHPMIVMLGSVSSQPKALCDGTSKAFDITSNDYIWDSRMTSTVCCVFDTACPHWSKTPVPNQNTVVFYIGHFSDTATSGSLQVELESIALNVGIVDTKLNVGTPSSSPSKRQKFMAVAPRGGDHTGTSLEASRVEQAISTSSNDHCVAAALVTRGQGKGR